MQSGGGDDQIIPGSRRPIAHAGSATHRCRARRLHEQICLGGSALSSCPLSARCGRPEEATEYCFESNATLSTSCRAARRVIGRALLGASRVPFAALPSQVAERTPVRPPASMTASHDPLRSYRVRPDAYKAASQACCRWRTSRKIDFRCRARSYCNGSSVAFIKLIRSVCRPDEGPLRVEGGYR